MRTEAPVFVVLAALLLAACSREQLAIRVAAPPENSALVLIRDAAGRTVRTLPASGVHLIEWDGCDDTGQPLAAGDYLAKVITYPEFTPRFTGRLGLEPAIAPLAGRAAGRPCGVVTDESRLYCGWEGGLITAHELDGRIAWAATLPGARGCDALSIDGPHLIALARERSSHPAQALLRLDRATGQLVPWPAGDTIPLLSLWPADAATKPEVADALGAGVGRIYLAFSELHFLAVLEAASGQYLQTIVGPAPTALGVVPTQTESPTEPGKIMDADFAVIALDAGALGKVLFAHDPLWVIGSDAQPLDPGERISALTLLGDSAPHFPRNVFLGLGDPHHQVQRREIIDARGYAWLAGQSGGRPERGPGPGEALGAIRAVALDAQARLWVAEGDPVPGRFSAWTTGESQGRLVTEIYGPLEPADRGVALVPGRPDLLVAGGCEWHLAEDGTLSCLGVITRDGMKEATFLDGATLVVLGHDGRRRAFQRRGNGDYQESATIPETPVSPPPPSHLLATLQPSGWGISLADGTPLGTARWPAAEGGQSRLHPLVYDTAGRGFALAVRPGIVDRVEITGLAGVQIAPPQLLRLRARR